MRRLIPYIVGLLVVAGGVLLLLDVFSGKDASQLATTTATPGTVETLPGTPPSFGPDDGPPLTAEGAVDDAVLTRALAQGNVALVYGTRRPPAGLAALREQLTGPFTAGVAAAGQLAFLVRRPGVDGIVALAWKRRLTVDAATDPRLRAFVDAWVGAGARG